MKIFRGLVFVLFYTCSPVFADTLINAWIKPTSGNWDDPSAWSLGVLPGSSQSVMITSSGWKAVAINPSTPVNFPDSMTVSNLTVRGAWDTENVLLLNYFGTAVPLTVLNGLTLQDDGRIVNFNSGLVVQGGTITVTNSQIIQDGGFFIATNSTMYLQSAEYNLTNGFFEAGQVELGLPVSASFNQYDGTVIIATLSFGQTIYPGAGGHYALYGGSLNLPGGLTVSDENNSSSSYFQAGGTNRTAKVAVYGYAGFTLDGGLLADDNVELLAGDHIGTATINQSGGTHMVTNTLSIIGGAANSYTVLPATYNLNGGTLSAGVIELDANEGDSVFVQSNAATTAGTVYAHSLGYFSSHNTLITLAGGSLSCSNFTLDDGRGSLSQSAGALVVSNLLTITGYRDLNIRYYGSYTFTGGTVTASNISITGDWIIGDGSTNRISNPGFFSLSHTLQIGNAVEQLGRFILASNATIDLAGSASRLSFANSSGQTWAGGATLVISDWNGNPSGGGAEQLRFGASATGLTASQLAQIQFSNPSGYPSGNYAAQLLSTGELVPASGSVPVITTQPTNLSVMAGSSATFTVGATSVTPLSYFWRRNGSFIAGATGSSYTTNNVQAADSGAVFSCLVSNSTGTTLSSNAVLTVVLTPPNDLCSGALVITNYPYTNSQSTVYATSQGDPTPACTMSGFGRGVWYQFTPPSNGEMVVDTFGSLFKPAFAIYSGSCGSLTEIGCNDAAVGTAAPVTNSVTAGVSYFILAGSYSNVAGGYTNDTLVLHLAFTPALSPPVIRPPVLDSNRFLFSFPTISGQTYVVEYKNQVANGNWIPLQTNTGDGGTATVTNALSASPQRFFRLRLK